MFQHFDLMTISVDIADGDPRVGFQLFQELSEASEIRLSGCLDHALMVSRHSRAKSGFPPQSQYFTLFFKALIGMAASANPRGIRSKAMGRPRSGIDVGNNGRICPSA